MKHRVFLSRKAIFSCVYCVVWSCLLLSIEYKWRSWPEEQRRAKCTTPALFKWGKNNCNVTSAAYNWWYSASKKIPASLPSLFYCCFQEKEIHFLTQIYPLPLLLLLQNFLLFSLQRALYSSRKNCIEVWWLMKGGMEGNSLLKLFSHPKSCYTMNFHFKLWTIFQATFEKSRGAAAPQNISR